MDAMPGVDALGTEYITFPNAGGLEREGYYIQVVSVSDGTVVSIPEEGLTVELAAGEFISEMFVDSNMSTFVSCSSPCLVVEYGCQDSESSSGDLRTGPYMITLTPAKLLSTDLVFTTSVRSTFEGTRTVLALVVEGSDEPVTNLYLDGVSLESEDWQLVDQSDHQYVMGLLLETGFHHLYSDDANRR
jgi:hypothetical protein